jgi:two-component system LytT family response regulator
MNIIIIDDEPLARERIKNFLNAYGEEVTIVAEADNGLSGLDVICSHHPDLVFLDIQMPEMDGFSMLGSLSPDERPNIIFTTAYDEYAVKAFEIHALDYLPKPFSKERFNAAMAHCQKELAHPADFQEKLDSLMSTMAPPAITRLSIKDQGRMFFVPLGDIHWIESAGNYVVVHTAESNHIMRETMTQLENQLPEKDFTRVSRSAIVRLDVISEISSVSKGDHHMVLTSGTKIKMTIPLKQLQLKLECS